MAKNQPDTPQNRNEKYLTAFKMGLEVLLAIALLVAVYWIIFFSIQATKDKPTYTKDEMTNGLVAAVLLLIFAVIGMVGVQKESKCIVIVYLVLVIISAGFNVYAKQYWEVLINVIIAFLGGAFLYFIIKKEKSDTTV